MNNTSERSSPFHIPVRTPHIHVAVLQAAKILTSRLYIKGEPQNERDSIYKSIRIRGRWHPSPSPSLRSGNRISELAAVDFVS
ncbi:MAG: hypothetical protein IPM55_23975 [Acidobacteria bacterium]|nr:hypothetical protein [Acidobacteriota bacterium]